ncbi:MAG: hypothetical protein JNK85_29705 [Verrucomicrobiales bacterium]|nr:hypothetical protein [Verrucomicrobiales bacterium]
MKPILPAILASVAPTLVLVSLTAAPLVCGAQGSPSRVLASSAFESGLEGWRGISRDTGKPEKTQSLCQDGNCFARLSEESGDGSTMFFVAPPAFLGDQSAAMGGQLNFRLRQNHRDQLYRDQDVLLISGNTRLVHQLPQLPTQSWRSFEVPLAAGYWTHAGIGSMATTDELAEVLANLDAIRIRGEFSSRQVERTDLDDVQLISFLPIEPPLLSIQRLPDGTLDVSWRNDASPVAWRLEVTSNPVNGPWTEYPTSEIGVGADGAWHAALRPTALAKMVRLVTRAGSVR